MFLLVNYGNVLCPSANKLQQNSNASCKEEYILLYKKHLSFAGACLQKDTKHYHN